MKQKLIKNFTEEGKNGKFSGHIEVILNAGYKLVKGTNAFTHDDYEVNKPFHLVAAVINTNPQFSETTLDEGQLVKITQDVTRKLVERLKLLANQDQVLTVVDKLKEIGFK